MDGRCCVLSPLTVEMPNTCCAVGCTNRASKSSNKRFFRVPADPKRKTKWVVAINRRNWLPNQYSRLCSDHFVSGELKNLFRKYSMFYAGQPNTDPAHPDYIPCVFKEGDRVKAERRLERYEREKQSHGKRLNTFNNNMDVVYILLEFSKTPRIAENSKRPP